jgi:cyclophilin family peptidyl-prolyl cis-trans isomerase
MTTSTNAATKSASTAATTAITTATTASRTATTANATTASAQRKRLRSKPLASAACLSILAAAVSCGGNDPGAAGSADTGATGSTIAPAAAGPDAAALDAILMAEQKRVAAEVRPEHLASHSVAVRTAAARALARIGGEGAHAGLLKLLADDHPDVVTWAAYGLGFWCKGHDAANAAALTARAVSLLAEGAPDKANAAPDKAKAAPPIAPIQSIARAIGACAAETSEATLVAWLSSTRDVAEAASLGLGELVSAKQKLREETVVALLQRASGSAAEPPLPVALYPLGRLDHPPPSTLDRLREVATASLAAPGPLRLFAVRALGRAGEDAAPALGRVVATPGDFTAAERGEAARALTRLGKAGQRALADAVPKILPPTDPVALTGLVSEDFGATLAALEAMTDAGSAEKSLREVASRPPPPSPPPAVARRLSWLRCTAAKLVAGTNFRDALLTSCEVKPAPSASSAPAPSASAAAGTASVSSPAAEASAGAPSPTAGASASAASPPAGPSWRDTSIAARAIVDVIGRTEITGARLAAWRSYADGPDLRAREAAIGLLEDHEEIENAAPVLARALAEKLPGVVGAAAEILTKHPERAAETPGKKRKKKGKDKDKDRKDDRAEGPAIALGAPSPAVVKALLALLDHKTDAPDPELDDGVIDAAAALGLKEAVPRIEDACKSPYPTTREHAAKAIALLTGKKVECAAPEGGGPVPSEMHALVTARTKLVFETDAGELTMTLDPALAPVAVTRFVELARSGYYDRMVVHRVVAGFVTQFGAPFGDGSGGPEGKPPLRCETSPLPFEAMTVGVALAGRDTGSSQLFVMHGRFPHLDGRYALVGTASGPWAAFVDGDLIQRTRVAD